MLACRRKLLDELVLYLIEQETISGEEFRERVERHEATHPQLAPSGG